MATEIHEDLTAIIRRYGQVADAVNRREMKRFIKEVRQRWDPDPPEEWEPHGEGYTDEGALALCIYQLALLGYGGEPERQGPLCEAEEKNQVLRHMPIDAMADEIPKPLAEPAPAGEVAEKLASLRIQVQGLIDQSAAASSAISIKLPTDFMELMAMTNGIRGAGVPKETAHTILVYPISRHCARLEALESISPWIERRGYTALAAWELGSCIQHRQIYYVLCHQRNEDPASASWRVVDRQGPGELYIHNNLAIFLTHETEWVEARPGGAQQEEILNNACENLSEPLQLEAAV